MARDDFSRAVIDRLAKRAGMKCSNPDCRIPTAGPGADGGVTNLGVAAHITAASPGGARYDETLTAEQRCDITNGIWLCQNHAKQIDDDELVYPPDLLRQWRDTAEHMAALEARGFVVRRAQPFAELERKAPALIAEMREDLARHPLQREIIVLQRNQIYNGRGTLLIYYTDDHPDLKPLMTIMEHFGALYEITYNNTPRFNLTEDFVAYLLSEQP